MSKARKRSSTWIVSVSVRPVSLPETMATAPYSPSARAAVRTTPKPTPARMAGRVIKRKICQSLAPSVRAACSCSVPISRSTGITSRATKGMQTKRVASTMPGSAKMTRTPCSASQPPNAPRRP